MNILRQVERTLRHKHIPPSRFGREVARDPRLVFDMRRGRELRPATAARILARLREIEGGGKPCAH